jgi:hypothetical protein
VVGGVIMGNQEMDRGEKLAHKVRWTGGNGSIL